MSHFSKIRTNISNAKVLTKTLIDMGFRYEYLKANYDISVGSTAGKDIVVYDVSNDDNPLFSFAWNGSQFNLVADLHFWNLGVDVNYFLDSLSQKYAYNIILDQSYSNGFHQVCHNVFSDGSVKMTLKRWSGTSFS